MTDIAPDPFSLGLASPQLGPWFQSDVKLGEPDPIDLSVEISNTVWMPPAAGTLALVFPESIDVGEEHLLHSSLFRLRNLAGSPRFDSEPGKLLALFTLLPEVLIRLRQLYLAVDVLGSRTDDSMRRDLPVQFALLFNAPTDQSNLGTLINQNITSIGVEALGLTGSGPFKNGPRPMAWLRRPGEIIPGQREDLINLSGRTARLFIFDEFGLPLDPGAVAAAFAKLQSTFTNLFISGLPPTFAPGRRLHFVSPLGGLPSSQVRSLVRRDGTVISGTENLVEFSAALNLDFSAQTQTNQPFARLGILPAGPYAVSASLAENQLLARDFLRVGLVDVEPLLTGASRIETGSNQERISTRINLARSTAVPTLLPNQEAVLQTAQAILDGTDPAVVISGVIDGSAGPIVAADLPNPKLPDALLALTLLPLQGGRGPDTPGSPGWALAMPAVVQVDLDATLVGAWVHVLPLDFDLETSERKRLAGGGGRAVAAEGNARATILLTLPPGDALPDEDDVVAFDVEIIGQNGKRLIGSQKVQRVARPAETPPALTVDGTGSFPVGAAALIICETGQRISPVSPVRLPSGFSVIAELPGGGFAQLDTRAAPFTTFQDGLGRRLSVGDVLVTTARVWKDDVPGDPKTRLSATGATFIQASRDKLNTLTEPGAPLPLMERRDILISTLGNTRADAILAALPLLDRFHELNPARPGRADEPAISESHATGVHLSGPAGLLAAEFAADRRFAATPELLTAITNNPPPPPPANPGGAGPLLALLRTTAAGVEGETQMHFSSLLPAAQAYPFNGSAAEKLAWLTLIGVIGSPLPGSAAAELRFKRFADRRVLGATQGFAEAGIAVVSLIRQAQRFIYIETADLSALDGAGDQDTALNVIKALRTQLLANPALHVLVCLPFEPVHPYIGIRRFLIHRTQKILSPFREGKVPTGSFSPPLKDRLVVFSPFAGPGRALQIASTTVIVDDAVTITGGFSLSRRGLTFDSSLAGAVFDERLQHERSIEVFTFRQKLLADRLGGQVGDIPADGAVLAGLVRHSLQSRSSRDFAPPKEPTGDNPGNGLASAYDPDGRAENGFNVLAYLAALIADVNIRDSLA